MKKSMEEKIGLRMVLVGLVAIALTAVLLLAAFHGAFEKQVEASLALTVQDVAAVCDPAQPERLAGLGVGGVRLTLVSPSGDVLFDSQSGDGLENHLSRPEVQAAQETGEGSARRTSETMGYTSYYYALRLADGSVLRAGMDAKNLFSFYNDALPAVGLSCIAVLAVACLAAMLLTRTLVRPIDAMADNLDDIEHHVPYKELEPLAQTIRGDRMLRENNESMRREFTANVSHEMKTPLTTISGYAELIETGVAKPEDVPGFAGKIRAEAGRMLSLIGDILELSELDSHHNITQFAAVDLYEVAKACGESRRMAAQKAYVTLEVTGAPAAIQGDRALLEELCDNLLDNAIRYNRPGGHVKVTVGPGAQLAVADDGIGIAPEHQQRVFERFYRVDKSRSKQTGDTGLGLAIVKHIAQQHGAKLRLESAEGKGTTITVSF